MNAEKAIEKWPRVKALKVRGILDRLQICGCGTMAHWKCVLELLSEAEKHTGNGFYRDQWFEFGAKVLDTWKLLEHGMGIGFAWLTDDGKILLEFLRDFGIDDHDEKDGSGQPMWSVEHSWDLKEQEDDAYSEWARSLAKENASV